MPSYSTHWMGLNTTQLHVTPGGGLLASFWDQTRLRSEQKPDSARLCASSSLPSRMKNLALVVTVAVNYTPKSLYKSYFLDRSLLPFSEFGMGWIPGNASYTP